MGGVKSFFLWMFCELLYIAGVGVIPGTVGGYEVTFK